MVLIWFAILYHQVSSCVLNNGHASVLKLFEEFKTNCGLENNISKTEALWLGSWRNCREADTKEPVQALGVHFSYDEQHANRLNFEEKIKNVEKVLNTWRRRNLTLIGRLKIVKSLGLSKIDTPFTLYHGKWCK